MDRTEAHGNQISAGLPENAAAGGFVVRARRAPSGRAALILLLLICVGLAWGGKLLFDWYKTKQTKLATPAQQSEAPALPPPVEPAPSPVEPTPAPAAPEAVPSTPAAPVAAAPKPPGIEDLDSLDAQKFPLVVRVIEPISLLNHAGQETKIPEGQVITIEKRSPRGTLTIDIMGLLYAGNESRLVHKVKRP